MSTIDQLHAIWAEGRPARPEELPTLDELRDYRIVFPMDALEGKTNALCLFSGWFCGRADVIHVLDAGIAQATLIDNHPPAISALQHLYPSHWTYWCGDYRKFLATAGRRGFDVVIADPNRADAGDVALNRLPDIARVCAPRFTLVINYWRETVAALGADRTDLAGLSQALSERSGVDAQFCWMERRATDLDWAVIEVDSSTR
jgi:hypothetical protein